MKYSPYITWAKHHIDVEYNLARSGMPRPDLKSLIKDPAEILEPARHEDGWPPLMERIAQRYGVDAEQVVPVQGCSMANHLAMAQLLEPGDHVLVETPVYDPLKALPKYFQGEINYFSRLPENNWQPDPGEIESKINSHTRLIVLSDLHNPTGMQLERDILKRIIDIAKAHSAHVLVDEVYLEFLYPEGERTASLLSRSVVTTRSLTKAYGLDDLRIGWIIAEPELAALMRRLRDLFSVTTALPTERLAWHALGHADELLEQNSSLLNKNRLLVDTFIQEQPLLSWVQPPAGTVGFVKLEGLNCNEFIATLKEQYTTLVAPGRYFDRPGWFRIGWGMETKTLEEGLGRVGEALREF